MSNIEVVNSARREPQGRTIDFIEMTERSETILPYSAVFRSRPQRYSCLTL